MEGAAVLFHDHALAPFPREIESKECANQGIIMDVRVGAGSELDTEMNDEVLNSLLYDDEV